MRTFLAGAVIFYQVLIIRLVFSGSAVSFLSFAFLVFGILTSWICVILLIKNYPRPILLMFCFFMSQYFGMAPAVQSAHLTFPGTTPSPPVEFANSALVYILILTLFSLFGYRASTHFTAKSLVRSKHDFRELSQSNIPRAEYLLAIILLNMLYIFYVGFSSFFSSYFELGQSLESRFHTRIFIAMARSLGTFPLATLLTLIFFKVPYRELTQKYRILMFAGCVSLFISCNPISSYRVMFGVVWASMVFAILYRNSAERFYLGLRLYILSLLFIFPIADYFRNRVRDFSNPVSLESLTHGDFDSFAQLLNTFAYVSEKGYGWGIHIISLPLFWVPRSIWASKPPDSALLIADFRGYDFNNISMPIPAELLLDFGIIGACLLFLGLGAMMAYADKYFINWESGNRSFILYGIYLIPYSLMLFRGSLLQAVSPIAVIVFCLKFHSSKFTSGRIP